MSNTPKSLQDAILYFADFDNCRQFMTAMRWLDDVVRCPYCGSEKVTYLAKARVYKCNEKHAKAKFSLKVGTVFEDSPIPLEKWLPAVWMLCNDKNGVSSYEIARALGVTQKSAWFMLHRIRLAMQSGSFMKMGGPGSKVEMDETFIGGKVKNMHKSRRPKPLANRTTKLSGIIGKTIVVGMLERNGRVNAQVVENRTQSVIHALVNKHLAPGTTLVSDEHGGYVGTSFEHEVINHANEYVNGMIHTNGIENFWSLLKRGLNGTYVSVEPFHLFRYLDEQAFRYNNRATKDNPLEDSDRFMLAMSQIVGRRLTYAELTGKVGETAIN
jgi:transposase-like protein